VDLSPVIHTLLAKLESLGIIDSVEVQDERSGTYAALTGMPGKEGWALTEFGEQVASFLLSRHDLDTGSDKDVG
jgi:hypothetical protein